MRKSNSDQDKPVKKKLTGKGGPGRGQGRFSTHEGGTQLVPIRAPVKQIEAIKDLNPKSVSGLYVEAMDHYLQHLKSTV